MDGYSFIKRLASLGLLMLISLILMSSCFMLKRRDCNCPQWSYHDQPDDDKSERIEPESIQ